MPKELQLPIPAWMLEGLDLYTQIPTSSNASPVLFNELRLNINLFVRISLKYVELPWIFQWQYIEKFVCTFSFYEILIQFFMYKKIFLGNCVFFLLEYLVLSNFCLNPKYPSSNIHDHDKNANKEAIVLLALLPLLGLGHFPLTQQRAAVYKVKVVWMQENLVSTYHLNSEESISSR